MFFRKRKRFNGDVAALLPAFGIDMDIAGPMKLLSILDVAWAQKYSIYEATLLVAYSYACGLFDQDNSQSQKFLVEKLLPVQQDWLRKGIVRKELVDDMAEVLARRVGDIEPEFDFLPNMPDITKKEPKSVFRLGEYIVFFQTNIPPIAERIAEENIELKFLFVLTAIDQANQKPACFVTLETGFSEDTFLCLFRASGSRHNFGKEEGMSESDFIEKATFIMKKELDVDDSIKAEIVV